MSTEIQLTPTSFIVLGLLRAAGRATPYELKAGMAGSVAHFWSIPHSQVYAEPVRLERAGLVREEREQGGRRRRTYELTAAGEAALDSWLADPAAGLPELRDPALLKLFFGADPAPIARARAQAYREQLALFESLHAALSAAGGEAARGPLLTLENGIGHARMSIEYWERLAA